MLKSDTVVVPANKLAWYRPDIDGLRALAVISVVIFHAFPESFPGGFTGVDVFFVISGFLISGIIFRGLDKGTFSFADFYSKRARRIFPALLLVLMATYILGWLALFDFEFKQLGSHIVAGIGFFSNFQLWRESGYFDTASELKPLLHLWSLGIEEQFYLLFPAIFFIAHRMKWNRKLVVGLFFFISFMFNIVYFQKHPSATFYNPATRFWEILLGSLLALILDKKPFKENGSKIVPTLISFLGLCLIFMGFFLAEKSTPFPGWFALLPTIGSFLLIGVGMNSLINRHLLANPIMIWFGAISYPLYLWHWPLLVYARVIKSEVPSSTTRWGIVSISVLLSWLTFKILENPLRFGGKNRTKVASLSFAMIVLALMGHRTVRDNGFSNREVSALNFQESFVNAEHIENTALGCGIDSLEDSAKFDRCQHDVRDTPTIALLGDSKARALSYGLFKASDTESRILFIGGSSAFSAPVPIISDHAGYKNYQPMIAIATDALVRNSNIKVVIITAATRAMYQLQNHFNIEDLPSNPNQEIVIQGLDRVVSQLVAAGKKVILTVDNPTLPPPPDCINRRSPIEIFDLLLEVKPKNCSLSFERHLELSEKYRKALSEVASRHPNMAIVFDTLPILGDNSEKKFKSIQSGHLYYSQTDHISDYAAVKIGEKLIPFAKEFGNLGKKPLLKGGE